MRDVSLVWVKGKEHTGVACIYHCKFWTEYYYLPSVPAMYCDVTILSKFLHGVSRSGILLEKTDGAGFISRGP
jgi:hypothetical protein